MFLICLITFLLIICLFFTCFAHHRDLHSFPTRRSSDLKDRAWKTLHNLIHKDPDYIAIWISDVLTFSVNVMGSENNVVDRKSTRLNSSHMSISYAVFCLKKKKTQCGP